MREWIDLPCDSRTPAAGRRFVRDTLARWCPSGPDRRVLADLELLASELVSNAVMHGHCSHTRLELGLDVDGLVHVEVSDPGAGGAIALRPADLDGRGGVGLRLVERLAARWGQERTPSGRTVWFEIEP